MKTKIKIFESGTSVTMEKTFPSGYYVIRLYSTDDELVDKMKCDTYKEALSFYNNYCSLCKNNMVNKTRKL